MNGHFRQAVDDADFRYNIDYKYDAGVGLSDATVDYISDVKGDADWIRQFRHDALKKFRILDIPAWAKSDDVCSIDYSKIRYYLANGQLPKTDWESVPKGVKETFERLGIPEKERKFLAGVDAQFDSESAYSRMQKYMHDRGIIFANSTDGLNKYGKIFKKYFSTVVPVDNNKFSALNSAVFSGGSFIYVPKGVKVQQPLQAYFRINSENFGQFERSLIIVDEGAELTYLEGCTAPKFETSLLHAAVVEVIAMRGAKIQYITVQNWSNSVFNFVTMRGIAREGADIRWMDCNIGSKKTMKYPAIHLIGDRSRGEILSISIATDGQIQDTGAKVIHLANNTTSNIVSKSISMNGGMAAYRGTVHVNEGIRGCKNSTCCDSMLVNSNSKTATFPKISATGQKNVVQHEASVSKINDEQIFYMQQRGIPEKQAVSLSVNGFINDIVREFPMEYSVEMKRLVEMQAERCVG